MISFKSNGVSPCLMSASKLLVENSSLAAIPFNPKFAVTSAFPSMSHSRLSSSRSPRSTAAAPFFIREVGVTTTKNTFSLMPCFIVVSVLVYVLIAVSASASYFNLRTLLKISSTKLSELSRILSAYLPIIEKIKDEVS